jgi:hypothetical protein
MSVYNAVGEGPLSPPQEVFVGEAGEYSMRSSQGRHRISGPFPSLTHLPLPGVHSLTTLHVRQCPQQHPKTSLSMVLWPHSWM